MGESALDQATQGATYLRKLLADLGFKATYSASVVDVTTAACFLLHQLTVELATLKTYPEVDRQLSASPAQSSSEKPYKSHSSSFTENFRL